MRSDPRGRNDKIPLQISTDCSTNFARKFCFPARCRQAPGSFCLTGILGFRPAFY